MRHPFLLCSRVIQIIAIASDLALSQTTDDDDEKGFDRARCIRRAINWLQDDTNAANTTQLDALFAERPHKNQSEMVLLTITGCHKFCGEPTLYFDWVSRVTIWTIPIFLLLSNIQLAPVSKKRFATILHALGDPIDSLWSLVQKAHMWHRLYQIALDGVKKKVAAAAAAAAAAGINIDAAEYRAAIEHGVELVNMNPPAAREGAWDPRDIDIHGEARVIATVLSGLEEVSGREILSETFYSDVIETFYHINEPKSSDMAKERRRKWNAAATQLVNGRTSDLLHTALGLAVYYFGIASALVDALGGGGGTPPGGRIACAIFLSWLVPLALLSNTFGAFSSRITCLDVMVRFFEPVAGEEPSTLADSGVVGEDDESVEEEDNGSEEEDNGSEEEDGGHGENLRIVADWNEYFDSAMWTGAMHTFRPWKVTYRRYPHSPLRDRVLRAVIAGIASFPPLVSMLGAFFIIYYAIPQGFTCRHVWVLAVFACWILSAILTNFRYGRVKKREGHWRLIFWKDALIGLVGSVAFPVASTIGAWNNCNCWSSAWPTSDGFIPVGVEKAYKDRQRDIYSRIIAGTQVLHVIFFVVVVLLYRNAIKIVWWRASHVQEQWERNHAESKWSPLLTKYLRLAFRPNPPAE